MVASEHAGREYLDLSKDPVQPGGLSRQETAELLNSGWTKGPLPNDVYAHVQFRDDGGLYYRDGWIKAGTEVFSRRQATASVFEGFEMVGGCKNIMIRR